ncbi:HAMP domain-containing histidine kinase [Pedobacter frigidisoli]|uniref:histidine kinase n=1 Tax=Pedobacter frigidisoli TaxID=2530455 RepID=A0A4R0P2W5_9SPHI|nr:HAMP domain-containing sensor histidine kinase [Pedobacter frigidisoli]TCD08358.1 HAMP domain-containing histidine kinase [Pedobacter frigidisoli]
MPFNKALFLLLIVLIYSCKLSNNKIDHPVLVDKIIDSASHLGDLKKREQANRYLDSCFKQIENPGIGDLWKKFYFKQSQNFIFARLNKDSIELEKAFIYADSMLALIATNKAEVKYKRELSIANFLKGDVLLEQEKYEQSYLFFNKGKLLADESGSTCDQADFNSRFAFLNYVQNKYRQAASLFLQAYKNNLACKLDYEKYAAIQGALDNAGLSYNHIKMTDSAMICFKKSLKFLESNEHLFPYKKTFTRVAKGVNYHYIGDVYLDSGNNEKAEEYLKKAIASNGTFGTEKRNAQIAEVKLARLYLNTGRYNDFSSIMAFARSSLDSLPSPKTEVDWQKLRIDYLNLTGKYEEAKTYIPNYLQLAAKQDLKLQKLNSVNARTEFYNLQKDYELTLLKKENQLNILYLIIAVGFSVMSMFILYQLWRNGKTSKITNDKLKLLNKQVTEQNLHLQKALSALEQSQDENKRVMKVVAHDLRSPIGAIVSLAGFMLSNQKLKEEEQHLIGLIKISGADSLKFVDDLLNWESASEELEKESVDLNALLNYCTNLLQYKASEKQQKIILKSEAITFNINREKIWRVISNLITNAIKFSPPKTNILVETNIFSDHIIISVKDQGIGIPAEMNDSIFNITKEAKRSGTNGEKSYGMGLVISKQIVEAHGGSLWFESTTSKGTTFFIKLPIA